MRPSLASLRLRPHVRLNSSARHPLSQRRFVSGTPQRHSEQASASDAPTTPTADVKGKEKATAQSAELSEAAADAKPLPLLNRPLGVKEKPSARVKTWSDTKEKFLDQDKRLEERHHLAREATRGYFSDLNATRRHGGKSWIAPKVMIREDRALYFPDIHGTSLATSQEKTHTTNLLAGKVSLVALLTTRISELQVMSFVKPTKQEFASHPLFQFVQINLQDSVLKSFLVSLFASGIRKTLPEPLWPTYMISSQNMEYLREPLGIANKHVGYVYLVDPNLKVRWAGCADPKSEEISALQTCTTVLLDRLSKREQSGTESTSDAKPKSSS